MSKFLKISLTLSSLIKLLYLIILVWLFIFFNLLNALSTFENPIIITRFNSYQSYRGVSANGGYTINLAVSGNKQPFVNSDSFYKDPYLHLKSFSTFVSATKGGFEAITSLKTSNTFIYARRKRLTPAAGIEYFNEPRAGTVFVGTSGTAEIYYYED